MSLIQQPLLRRAEPDFLLVSDDHSAGPGVCREPPPQSTVYLVSPHGCVCVYVCVCVCVFVCVCVCECVCVYVCIRGTLAVKGTLRDPSSGHWLKSRWPCDPAPGRPGKVRKEKAELMGVFRPSLPSSSDPRGKRHGLPCLSS